MAIDTIATDFAITTVNVPDRLDVQEVRARQDEDYIRPGALSFDRYLVGLWLKRIFWIALLAAGGYYAYQAVNPIRQEIAPQSIAARITEAIGQPTTIADTEIRLAPSPRLVLKGVDVSGFHFEELALHINWTDSWRALRGGRLVWGEASVGRQQLTVEQASVMLQTVSRASPRLPETISTIRFELLQLKDSPILNDRYEAVIRRGSDGSFSQATLLPLGGGDNFRMIVSPVAPTSLDPIEAQRMSFRIEARDFSLPFGPRVRWSEVSASGYLQPGLIFAESYLLTGFYGAIQGVAVAAHDVEWALTGTARATNIDLEAILQALKKNPTNPSGERVATGDGRVPLQGTATMDLRMAGRGQSLEEALARGSVKGPAQVRWGVLNGINLGFVATQGGLAAAGGLGGGITRFTELEADVEGGSLGVTLRDVSGKAGALSTRGEIVVGNDLQLSGALRVELGLTRIHAPLNLKVRGTALAPQFGR